MANLAQGMPCVEDLEDYQSLIQERAVIDAKLASLQRSRMQPTASASATTTQHGRQHLAQNLVPRIRSQTSPSMSRTVSGRGPHEAPSMSNSRSQRSATNMARSWSKGSSSSNASMPWTNTGRVPPPLQIESYSVGPEEAMPHGTLNQHPRPMARSMSQRKPELEILREIDSGMHPDDFFAQSALPFLAANPSPLDLSVGGEWPIPNQARGSYSSRRRPSFGIQTPETPSTSTLTLATTYKSEDMSRQSSVGNEVLGPFALMQMNSSNSFYTDPNSVDDLSYESAFQASFPKSSSSEDQGHLVAGAGASHDSSFEAYQDAGALAALYPDMHPNLERSQSSESHVSTSSTKSRGANVLQRQVQVALARPLAPKAGAEEASASREGSNPMLSIKSRDGSEDKVVAQIPKTPYQRPKHERVYCTICADDVDGFRGLHELHRHIDRQHKLHVKKWVCIEPVEGFAHDFKPVYPLSRCKTCQSKKKYGAYYNAAAHLRRSHFKPKARGRSKSTKLEDKLEKRAGNGGGDWPPMSELKRWMEMVSEQACENQAQASDEDEEEEDADDSGSNECDDDHVQPRGMSNDSTGVSNLDGAGLSNDAIMMDTDATTMSNYDLQGMQDMPYDHPAFQHGIDLSTMPMDSSQSYVDSQLTSLNDHMAFIDNFHMPQDFDGSSLSQDLFNSNFPYSM